MAPTSDPANANAHAKESEAALSLCIMSKPSSSSSSPSASDAPVPPAHLSPAYPSLHPPMAQVPPPILQNKRSFPGTKAPMQNGSVAVEEMSRLMRVYGPIKSVRVRSTDKSKPTKVMSVKRKFYRWFPDFDSR